MEYVDPPPIPIPDSEKKEDRFEQIRIDRDEERNIVIGKAKVRDVQEILELINGYAADNVMLPRGPQYAFENIRDFVIAADRNVPVYGMLETHELLHLIVACGSLHVLWGDMAEIRALATHPKYYNMGLGRRIVEHLVEEAREIGIRKIYTFTLTEEFFSRLGFERLDRDQLPAKMWGECSRCPKYFNCDEIGMLRVL